LVVKCPYGEKKGLAVFCKLINEKVSPLKYPCTSDHYEKCPIYQKYAKREAAEEKEAPKSAPATAPPPPLQAPRPAVKRVAFKRPEEAENCYECIFYSELTKMCLKLKVRVQDPYHPPCKS